MYYLRGTNLTNVTFDDYNYTDINYTNFNYTNHTAVQDPPIFVSWLEWFLSWIYL